MTAANPRLIYCSLPGFGSDDPRAQVRAWEGVIGAATGAYRATHATNGRPVYTVVPYGSMYAAFLCAVTVAMALNARERSGLGQRVEIPLFDATFSVVGARGLLVNGKPVPEPEFNWSRQLPCKDGRWLMYVANNKRFEAFIKSIGMDKWRDAKLPPKELAQKFDETMRARTAKEWEDIIAEIGSEGVICHTSAEWLKHPQALESKIIADYDDPELGRFRGPGINARLSVTPGSVRTPRPKTDAHRAEILQELAATQAHASGGEPAKCCAPRSQGVKVVDLCIVLAGPTCGRTLAEFGADVIKIDSPHVKTVLRHNDINRGKRSVLVDLKTKEGLEIFWKLVDKADVVLQNFRGGVAEKLGIDYERVRARRPDIVYGSMNTFGHIGPYANRPGHEQLGQAVSGMQVRFGSAKPATAPFAANDYGTGLMACYGVALALLHRRRTGEGQFVDSALAYTATMLQSALLQDYKGKEWNEPHGQEATGSGPLNRLYQASDGWLFLAARRNRRKSLRAARNSPTSPDSVRRERRGSGARAGRAHAQPQRGGMGGRAQQGRHRRPPRRAHPARADDRSADGGARPRHHPRSRRLRADHHHGARCEAVAHAGDARRAGGQTRIGCRERARGNRDERRAGPADPREGHRGGWRKGGVLKNQLRI